MNILLTGGTGFLGSYLYKYLSKSNNVYTCSRNNSNYEVDLVTEIPDFKKNFEIVIHSAGMAHLVPKNESQEKLFYDVNVNGTKNLLEGLSLLKRPKYFLLISSVSVYGLNSGVCINEEYTLSASDPYGRSKIEAEIVVKNWCRNNNVICTILRLPLILGANPPGNLGAMINAIRNNYYFNISNGEVKKSMVLASDVSKFVLIAAEIGGTYNLTDGCHPNFIDFSHLIANQLGKRFVLKMPMFIARCLAFVGDILGDKFPINSYKLNKITSTLTFDDLKARNAFGWNPTPVLKGFKINE